MRIKLDENMPTGLAHLLRTSAHDISTVPEEGISGAEDAVVLKAATYGQRVLMTFDADFGDIRSFPLGSHSGVIVFRLHDQRWAVLKEPAERLLASGLIDRLQGGLAVVNETRIRVRYKERPSS